MTVDEPWALETPACEQSRCGDEGGRMTGRTAITWIVALLLFATAFALPGIEVAGIRIGTVMFWPGVLVVLVAYWLGNRRSRPP
jgi:hypothetical protein